MNKHPHPATGPSPVPRLLGATPCSQGLQTAPCSSLRASAVASGCGRAAGSPAPGGAASAVKGTHLASARSHLVWGRVVCGSFFASPCLGPAGWGEQWSPKSHSRVLTPRDPGPSLCRVFADGAGMGRYWVGWPPSALTGVLRRFGDTEADTRGRAPRWGDAATAVPPYPRGPPYPRRAPRPARIDFHGDQGRSGR